MLCKKYKHKEWIGAIKHIQSMKKSKGGEYAAYYCAGCNSYHITSNVNNSKFLKFKG